MRRSSCWICGICLAALLATAGCNGPDGHRWAMPWQKSIAKEEYQVPPVADYRFSEPSTLPKSAMNTGIRPKSDAEQQARGPGAGMGNPGAMGGRPSAMGGY